MTPAKRRAVLKRIHEASVRVQRGTMPWSCVALDGENGEWCDDSGPLADTYVAVFGYTGQPCTFQGDIWDAAEVGYTTERHLARKPLRLLLLAFFYEFVRSGDVEELACAP